MSISRGSPRIRPQRSIERALFDACKHTLLMLKKNADPTTCLLWHARAINRIVRFIAGERRSELDAKEPK